jgi:hypothetical protein
MHYKNFFEVLMKRITQSPSVANVKSFTGTESLFSSDEYLIPALENDALLRKHEVSTYTISKFIRLG